jgi:hypothetical protein
MHVHIVVVFTITANVTHMFCWGGTKRFTITVHKTKIVAKPLKLLLNPNKIYAMLVAGRFYCFIIFSVKIVLSLVITLTKYNPDAYLLMSTSIRFVVTFE